MGSFFLQDIHFSGLPLLVLLGEPRMFLAFCLEDIALPGGVTGIFTMKRAIQLVVLLLALITMLVFGLEALFLPWLTVLV